MNLVHNPTRYVHILNELQPEIETEKDHVELPFLPSDEKEQLED